MTDKPLAICVMCNRPIQPYYVNKERTFVVARNQFAHEACYDSRRPVEDTQAQEAQERQMGMSFDDGEAVA